MILGLKRVRKLPYPLYFAILINVNLIKCLKIPAITNSAIGHINKIVDVPFSYYVFVSWLLNLEQPWMTCKYYHIEIYRFN
jgi:hypothetical protein